jgi:hypothetical protein
MPRKPHRESRFTYLETTTETIRTCHVGSRCCGKSARERHAVLYDLGLSMSA